MELQLNHVSFLPVSMVTREGLQRVDIRYCANKNVHLLLDVWDGAALYAGDVPLDLLSGERYAVCLLPVPKTGFQARWCVKDLTGAAAAEGTVYWDVPRHWEISVMISSHTDIGLHNSQYIQRFNSERFLDEAMRLCDRTDDRPENDRYRYTMEGTWFWSNFGKDRGDPAAKALVEDYIKTGKIGVCAGVAGSTTQVYGLEELCRSTYNRRWLRDTWGIDSRTMTMIDNNGLNWSLVQPYADAGYEYLFFAPNCWNPLPSSIAKHNTMIPGAYSVPTYVWNPQGGGGGARIDVRYDSPLPMVFRWQGAHSSKALTVFCSAQYDRGGNLFGLMPEGAVDMELWEDLVARQLPAMEARYPYDMWLLANYSDDQYPDIKQVNDFAAWNAKWQFPVFRAAGDLDSYCDRFLAKFGGQIPTLRGEITGGWYQLAVSVADALADKFAADRALPQAETLSSFAALADPRYPYPAEAFRRSWEALLVNDEHSYGCSGYAGSPVFETWMQHRDWVESARKTAETASESAMASIAAKAELPEDSILVFNTTLQERRGWIRSGDAAAYAEHIPPAGYTALPVSAFRKDSPQKTRCTGAPVVENAHYRIRFGSFGGMESIWDKALGRELLTPGRAPANTLLYTNDNHKTFFRPEDARFTVCETAEGITVTAEMNEPKCGAAIVQKVTLPGDEKVIRIENDLSHVHGLFNANRYHRFLYYAFPFSVPEAKRLCHLGGCVAEYAKDLTGHGTDVYMNMRDWCCMENGEFGVGFMQLDSSLVEFDHIHPDKTDWDRAGDGSQLYIYLANDWHQRQIKGGSRLDLRFRFQITSYEGDHLSAKLPETAERYANPLFVRSEKAHAGTLPASHSFLSASSPVRLLTLKRGHDGLGVTARVYDAEQVIPADLTFSLSSLTQTQQVPLSTDESAVLPSAGAAAGFAAYGLGKDAVCFSVAPGAEEPPSRAPIGAWHTGLIRTPVGGCSDEKDLIYLLWGQSMESDLASYELFRGDTADFVWEGTEPHAVVEPGPYRVVRYEDHGCAEDTEYFYRVRAVYADGSRGPVSDVFSGATREPFRPEGEGGQTIKP